MYGAPTYRYYLFTYVRPARGRTDGALWMSPEGVRRAAVHRPLVSKGEREGETPAA